MIFIGFLEMILGSKYKIFNFYANLLSFWLSYYIIMLSFPKKEIFKKGGEDMTSYDLIWYLITLLLSEEEKKLNAKEKQKKD